MSLILDALRKAEAERQRGHVPGLHGAPAAPVVAQPQAAPMRWLWPAGVILLLGVLAFVWLRAGLVGDEPSRSEAAKSLPAQAAPATTPPTPAVPAAPAPPAAEPLPLVVSVPPPTTPAPPVRSEGANSAGRDAPIITRLRRLADLPAEQRRELPPLVVSGSVWSEQATARFVMLDGQLLREGDSLVPGLVLVKLAPRAATLRWRDLLIEVPL